MTATPYQCVASQVDRDQDRQREILRTSRKACRINDGAEIVGDEPAVVAAFAGQVPKMILEWRERADIARDLDVGAPGERGQV